MIAFDLQCPKGHKFEGWFEDAKAYEEQRVNKMIACPVCNDTAVYRIPSAFSIKSSSPTPSTPANSVDLEQVGREISSYIDKNFDNVGCNFAKEALKIHFGVTTPRNIRGVSTKDEEKMLKKEGVKFLKVPLPTQSDSEE